MMPTPPLPPQVPPSPSSQEDLSLTTHSCSSLPVPQCTGVITTMTASGSPRRSSNSSLLLHANTTHAPSSAPAHPNSKKTKQQQQRGSMARQKRNSWMRSSVVRRAATVVDEEVAALCEKSPFLNSLNTTANNNNEEIALFHRLEVHLGKALGRGGFAEVYSVAGLDVQGDDDDDDDDDPRVLRRKACQQKLSAGCGGGGGGGRPAFAIKFLRKKLLSNTREFQHAAIDLAVESKYLAALSHRNIIKIRGLTAGGTGAFRTGKHDDFFIIMDHLQETLEHRIQRWQQKQQQQKGADSSHNHDDDNDSLPTPTPSPSQYFPRTLDYAHQIADALAYLHDKAIVYRDLKPQNLGFSERDTIQLFDFGLCRELPIPKGQCQREENLEDEETFHMSGVGTQRYMAPEILNTRKYNLKADVYSWSMVALEMMTWRKPFAKYTPEEHQKYVAGLGERPQLITTTTTSCEEDNQQSDNSKEQAHVVNVQDWPVGMAELLQESWTQDVVGRLTMQSVLERMGTILGGEDEEEEEDATQHQQAVQDDSSSKRNNNDDNDNNNVQQPEETEVFLEFPSHFSPRHPLLGRHRQQKTIQPKQIGTRDDSDVWFGGGDRQLSDASNSYQELTMTSTSTTMHDSNSTS